jgi:hypothetical protein
MPDDFNDIFIDRSGRAAKADYTLDTPREANFVKRAVRAETSEDVSGKQALNRVIWFFVALVIATLPEFRVKSLHPPRLQITGGSIFLPGIRPKHIPMGCVLKFLLDHPATSCILTVEIICAAGSQLGPCAKVIGCRSGFR